MSRDTFIWDRLAGRIILKTSTETPYSPKPYSDACDLRSQVDGSPFTSKAALRLHYRRSGVIEVGTEPMHPAAPARESIDKHDIRRIIWEHRNER